jgi:hypothetical protein
VVLSRLLGDGMGCRKLQSSWLPPLPVREQERASSPSLLLARLGEGTFENPRPHISNSTATIPTSAYFLSSLSPETAIMSDGEIEVESPSGYAVLPKDVTDEIGSIKLFNKARPSRKFEIRTPY